MNERVRKALAPTAAEIAATPAGANTRMAASLLGSGRKGALDIGCGEGKFTRGLTAIASSVRGVDVKEKAIAKAREAAKAEGSPVEFLVASGESLPFPDASFDVVAFSNSLHHIPNPAAAIAEAVRVLAPGGSLYMMEPVPAGNYHEATKLVNDETVVRTEAYEAMLGAIGPQLEEVSETMYRSERSFADFDEWKADQIDRDEKRRAKFDAQPEVVRSTFIGNAVKDNGRLSFTQVFRINLLRKK
jgi:ubiquinone/menaquinone biosynthesis C-methylase UbiE